MRKILNAKETAHYIDAAIMNTEPIYRDIEEFVGYHDSSKSEFAQYAVYFIGRYSSKIKACFPWLFMDDCAIVETLYTIVEEWEA